MIKNQAGQSIGAQMTAVNGSDFTGAVTVYVTGDNGVQTIGSTGGGACTHEGHGYHSYEPSQAETNHDHAAFTFVGAGAITVTVQAPTVSAAVATPASDDDSPSAADTGDDLQDAIANAAIDGVRRVRTDAGEVEAHSIPDQIEAAKFAAAQQAQQNRRTIRLIRILPPGAA